MANVTQRGDFLINGGNGRCPNRCWCYETTSLSALKGQPSSENGSCESAGSQRTVSYSSCHSASNTPQITRHAGSEAQTLSGCVSEERTLRLSGRVINLQVEGLCVGTLHHGDVVSCPLVRLGQRVGSPVGPVHLPAVHGDSEGVGQILMTP